MAKTINLGKLNAIFNEYLKSDAPSFNDFIIVNGYLSVNGTAWDFTNKATSLKDSSLNFDKSQPNKYAEYLLFLARNKKFIFAKDKVNEANLLADKIATYFLIEKVALGLSKEDKDLVMKELAIGSKKVKTEKNHPKWRWFVKKILIPAAVGVGIGVAAGLGLGLASLAIGTVPFVSESIGFTLQAYSLIGALVAGVATPAIVNVKDAIVTTHHRRKLNAEESLSMILEDLDDETALDYANMENLPVKKFLDSYLALDAKLIDSKENSNMKHPGLWVKRFGDRNKLHAIYDFEKAIEDQIEKGNALLQTDTTNNDVAIAEFLYPNKRERKAILSDPNVTKEILHSRLQTAINRRKGLLDYINQELFGDIIENFISYKKGADSKFRMADIDIKHGKGYSSKEKDLAVINKLVKPIYEKVLTTGFGSVENPGHSTEKKLVELANIRENKRIQKETSAKELQQTKQEGLNKKKAEKERVALENIKTDAETAYKNYNTQPTHSNFNSYINAQETYIKAVTDLGQQQKLTDELKVFKDSRIEEERITRYEKVQKAYKNYSNASRKDKEDKFLDYCSAQISYLDYTKIGKPVEEQQQIQKKINDINAKIAEIKERKTQKSAPQEEIVETTTVVEETIETPVVNSNYSNLPIFAQRMVEKENARKAEEAKKAEEARLAAEKAEQERQAEEARLAEEKAEQERQAEEARKAEEAKAEEARLLAEKTARLEQENAKLKAEQERLQKEAEEARKAEEARLAAEAVTQSAAQDMISFKKREKTQAELDLAKAKSRLRTAQAKAGSLVVEEEQARKILSETTDEAKQKEINAELGKNATNRAKVSQKITELQAEIAELEAVVEQEKTAAATNNSNND